MKIIYVSSLISEKKMNYIIENSINKPLQSIQKFHRLICEGIAKSGVRVKAISAIPMSRNIQKNVFWKYEKEEKSGVEYEYLPFINFKFLRQVTLFLSIIVLLIKECLKNKESIFICDVLNTTISVCTRIITKVFRRKSIAIVTDLPNNIGDKKHSISREINNLFLHSYDGYILLTEQMNEIVNLKSKPYIVIEGIADENMEQRSNNLEEKYLSKVCMYAGGLYEKYGVKALVEAFLKLEQNDVELHIFGSGELELYLKNISDERIKYYGVVTNKKIIEEEIKSTLLINPRFTNEEYTKFSFPSKNIEYMVSGTPVLTTKLLGMPKEYNDYVYFIEEETIDGILDAIKKVLDLSKKECNEFGKNAKKFILENKNNKIQAKKILNFCKLI